MPACPSRGVVWEGPLLLPSSSPTTAGPTARCGTWQRHLPGSPAPRAACTSAVSNILRAPSFLFYERGFEILRAPSFICYERGFEILRAPFHTFYERRHFCFTSAVFQFYERRFNRRSIFFVTSAVLNACLWNLPYVIVIMFYERGNDRVRLVFDDFLFLRARMATNPGL